MFNRLFQIYLKKWVCFVFLLIISVVNSSHAADCRQKLLPTSPVVWMGEFENFRYTEEHQYGESIALWRSEACVFGYLISVAGLQGDPPMGLIENAVYEPKTGKLSFNAMLSLGMTTPDPINKPNVSIPSTDWFTVKGILTKKVFRGTVQNNSRQYYVSSEIASKKTVHLKKSNDSYYDEHQYKNYGEWQLEFKK